MSTRITRRQVLAGGAGALALSAMGVRAQANRDPIKIGMMAPLTGMAAGGMIDVISGARIAIAMANASGGVNGRQLELVMRDDKANPNDAVATCRELLGDGIKFLLGGTFTATSIAVLPAVKEAGAIFTAMTSSTMRMGHQDFTRQAFHFMPNPYMSQRAEAKTVTAKAPNVTKWIAVGPDVEYGHVGWSAFAGGLQDYLGKAGKKPKLLAPVWTKFGASDYKAAASSVVFSDAEGLYTTLTGADLVTFLSQGKALGMFEKIKVYADIANDVMTGRSMGKNMPNNYWTATLWYPQAPNASALSKRCHADFKAMVKDKEPTGLFACGFGSTQGYIQAMRAAKSTDVAAVIAAMEGERFETPGGMATYRKEDHQALAPLGVVRMGPIDPGQPPALEYVALDLAEVIEPLSPGKEFLFPEPAVG